MVDVLSEDGDPLTTRRRVDHCAYFPDQNAQQGFASAAEAEGFEVVRPMGDAPAFAVELHRVDSVEPDHIHGVTGVLEELAKRFNGEYDGWGTSVESASNGGSES